MGRLTLNVLLSFAQFEREVTGERIRDKIAASKAKGMWMGGNVPLGYNLGDRRLIVNPAEAETVRHIFARYSELRSGVALARELQRDGIVSKRWTSRSGRERGGTPFNCGALYYLLQNRLYLGEIVHRGLVHSGQHEPIIARELFDTVQRMLAESRRVRKERPARSKRFHLAGIIVGEDGKPLTTSFSYGRVGRQYCYYVAGSLDPLRAGTEPPVRIPAAPLERLILETMCRLFRRDLAFTEILPSIAAVELRERSIQIVLKCYAVLEPHEPLTDAITRLQPLMTPVRIVPNGGGLRLIIDREPVFRGGRSSRLGDKHASVQSGSNALLLMRAHSLLRKHSMSPLMPASHADASAPAWQRHRRTMSLGLLAPGIQKQILQRRFTGDIERLMSDAPLLWADQL
jgi:hypothetical protein